jgi:hypothetical protein
MPALVSSTAAATRRQLDMFVVNKVIQEGRHKLLTNELESITLPDTTTQSFGPTIRTTCLLSSRTSVYPESVRNPYNSSSTGLLVPHKTFVLSLSRAFSRTITNSSARCVYPSLCPSETRMPALVLTSHSCSQHSELLLYLRRQTPAPQITLRALRFPACPPRGTRVSPFTQAILLRAQYVAKVNSSNSSLARLR